ncbi:Transmembrane protein 184-like protein [Yarrowia sp. B02]|nr:Transmembrane protein 184-like protein [Yarrowia sp. B02]
MLPNALVSLATWSTFLAIAISSVSILLQLYTYTRPSDQRLVVRILFLVPLFALSSWLSLLETQGDVSVSVARFNIVLSALKEIYEAFTLYTFFSLLTNLLGGERNIIFTTQGRAPLNTLFGRVNISDPHEFLLVKRAVLQYVWIKPVISVAIFLCKVFGVYKQGEISWTSGYTWIGVVYNVSVSLSLYALGIFWMCLHTDLQPYNPWPKFLCIKLIIFFSYWQGVVLAIAQLLGIIQPESSAPLQDWFMCLEMTPFAILHMWAFPHDEYCQRDCGFARLPVWYALRDVLGIGDLVYDFKSTFWGKGYTYRNFDSVESVIVDHPDADSRVRKIMSGLRYTDGGRGKYWLNDEEEARDTSFQSSNDPGSSESSNPTEATSLLNTSSHLMQIADIAEINDDFDHWRAEDDSGKSRDYGAVDLATQIVEPVSEQELYDDDDLYFDAREQRFGDFNYRVKTVKEQRTWRTERSSHERASHGRTGL